MRADVVLLILSLFSSFVASQWTYKNQGFLYLAKRYGLIIMVNQFLKIDEWPRSCRGKLQSPINIDKKKLIARQIGHLQFDPNYHHGHIVNITNSGHTVDVKILNKLFLPGLRGGGLADEYVLLSMHFHWHSEHTVNRERYPLESHFVHYAKKYKTLENALNYKDGVVVLAIFFNVTRQPNPAFDSIIKGVHAVAHKINGSIHLHHPISFPAFFPENTKNFYRYQGSLTTPNCNEVVTWTLFTDPSHISNSQLRSLTHIWAEKNHLLTSNYRKIQDLNERSVYVNV